MATMQKEPNPPPPTAPCGRGRHECSAKKLKIGKFIFATMVLCASTARGASARYTLPSEITSSSKEDRRLIIQLGGVLTVSTEVKEEIRIPVVGDGEGKILIKPLKAVFRSKSGQEYPAGFSVCSIGEQLSEVRVSNRFSFSIDGGIGFVPAAGSYQVRIEVLAITSTGESFILSGEAQVVVKEPIQTL